MKFTTQFTIGNTGYFLIMFMALKAMIMENDPLTFILLFLGALAMINYMHFLEKKYGRPKQSAFIKFILSVLLVISGVIMLQYNQFDIALSVA